MKDPSPSALIAIATLAVSIPASYILFLISQAGDLSNFDYWWIIWNFYGINGFSPNLFDWIFRANEHFLFIPSLLYALNIVLTQGSNIGLCLITWIFAWLQCHFLMAMLPVNLRRSPFIFIFLIGCIAIFNFTPAAAHNWMRGFSGVAWMGANFFVILAIFFLKKVAETQRIQATILSLVCALAASMCYSTPLAVWPVFCAVPFLLKWPRKLIITYNTVAFLTVSLYFLTYKTPATSPSLEKLSLAKSLTYFPVYLGAIFSNHVPTSLLIGILGLIIFTLYSAYWLLTKKPFNRIEWLPWLSIQVYTLGTALMAAVSRSGFGVEQAAASRYASLPALFWMSQIILGILWLRQQQLGSKLQKWLLVSLFILVTFAIFSMYRMGFETAATIAHRATYQPLVALSVQLGITDLNLIQERVGNRPAAFVGLLNALEVNHLVPFNRDIKTQNPCASLGTKIEPNLLAAPKDGVPGYFDAFTKFTPSAGRVAGWIGDPENQVHCIVILNQENVVRGFALSGFSRPDVAKLYGPSYEFSAWRGYVQLSPSDKLLTAYASFKNRSGWTALRNSQVLQ